MNLWCKIGFHKWRKVNFELTSGGYFEQTFRCVRCDWGKTKTIHGTIIHPNPHWEERPSCQ